MHTGVLPPRDEPLARFERWLSSKLEAVTEPAVRGPVEQFAAIAALNIGDGPHGGAALALSDITTDSLRAVFAAYAESHEAASIRHCWSTWNVLCTFLYTAELIPANPMQLVGRPKLANTLPKSLPTDAVSALLGALESDA